MMVLRKLRAQCADERDVQAIEPSDGLAAGIAVVMPTPCGSRDEVTALHEDALPVDCGVRAGALEDQPDGRLRVSVAPSNFPRQDQLQPTVKCRRERVLVSECRVLKDQNSSLRFFCADELSCLHEQGPHVGI